MKIIQSNKHKEYSIKTFMQICRSFYFTNWQHSLSVIINRINSEPKAEIFMQVEDFDEIFSCPLIKYKLI
jgi:hypothetical protein